MSELTGRVALITGGGRGIGRAAALELARQGADVIVVARSLPELERVAAEVRQLGRQALARAVDVTEANVAQQLLAETRSTLGPVTILVNNAAAVGPFGATWEVNSADWEQAVQVNLIAPFRLVHAAVPEMLAQGTGRIINISSGAARNPMERTGPYSTSKAALDMFTRQLGVELADSGVAAICVYPGIVDTAMQTAIREQPADTVGAGVRQLFQEFYSSGRLQTPDRPARLIAALAGAAGAAYNGQIVDIYSDEAQQLLDQH